MSCNCGKTAYGSEREARAQIRLMNRAEGRTLRVYRCPADARLWHLSSQGKARHG